MNQIELREHVHKLLVDKVKKDKVVNQKALAQACDVTEMTVSKWLRDDNPTLPASDLIPSICKALNIDIKEFFGEDNSDVDKALKLYKAYKEHNDQQASINKLLDINEL